MKEELISTIKKELEKTITPKRFYHTLGVVKASVYLAEKYNENILHAKIAALLHDFAKDYTNQQLIDYISFHKIIVDDIMLATPELLHGKVAASIAETKFNIKDTNILNAIKNHTTARQGMSKLEKIIYLADFIEENRDYPGVEDLRKIADKNLDEAVLQALNNTIIYVLKIEKLLHPNTLHARNEMLLKITT